MTNADAVYEKLLTVPGDVPTMLVLADALYEEGQDSLAAAYRWAAERGKWPFQRRGIYSGDTDGQVYDWDAENRRVDVPDVCRLPRSLYDAIRRIPDRRYGTVHQAFILLARALEAANATVPAG